MATSADVHLAETLTCTAGKICNHWIKILRKIDDKTALEIWLREIDTKDQ